MTMELKFTLTIKAGGESQEFVLGARHVEALVSTCYGDTAEFAGLFAAAAQHPSAAVRRSVASLQHLPGDAAMALARDPSAMVRRNVLQNQMFQRMAGDDTVLALIASDPEVAETVAFMVTQFENTDSNVLCEALLQHQDPDVRRALANNSATPMKWLRKLRTDASGDVADAALQALTMRSR